MKISELNPDQLSDEQITALLFRGIRDDGKKGDCILVFGSLKAVEYRLPKAVELYRQERAPKLLFSGGVTWQGSRLPEAVLLKNRAIELGVLEEDILLETASKNTKENILYSQLVLDRCFGLHKIKRLLIVTTPFHMRRAYLNAKTYMPGWIGYSLCPAEDQSALNGNWQLHARGRKRALDESRKIIRYVRMGALLDEEI